MALAAIQGESCVPNGKIRVPLGLPLLLSSRHAVLTHCVPTDPRGSGERSELTGMILNEGGSTTHH